MKHLPWLVLFVALMAAVPALADEKAAGTLTYEQHVRPILKAHCFECHGEGEKLNGGLDLRLQRLLVKGGESGAAIIPGKRDDSLLYQRIRQQEMPPGKKKLTREEIDRIGQWIAAGARTAKPEPMEITAGLHITDEERSFWAFQPIRRPAVPTVKNGDRVRNPIDAFLLARLEDKGLTFAPEADRRTLIRRATFDLLGLPPAPAEVDRFLADDRPDAYERLIDRLLASPRYGERWGRHWLDVAGYADSDGYATEDFVRPYAWKYRDYVIRALNADKPWDQFIQEQLAGDELVKPPYVNLSPADVDRLVATGFLRMAPDGTTSTDVDQSLARNAVMADTLKIVSTAFLGLTVGCAQCHNHRYDPIPQTDYYRLRAIFEPAYDWKNWRTPPARLLSLATAQKQLLKDHPSVNVTAGSLYLYDRKAADELKQYADRADALRATKPVEEFVMALTEVPGKVPTTFLFHRGDHEQPKQALAPAGLSVLEPLGLTKIPAKDSSLPSTGRRLAFARHLTDGKHPLTARVLVNRFWMHHFGRGIVGTPGEFGALGELPTHPELLDWLASEFTDGGWRLKRLHRLIVTSTAYRQVSRREREKERIDPENYLLGRMPVRRLEAEEIRDAILAVSGKLNGKQLGPPVPVMVDEVGQVILGVDTRDGAGRPTGRVVPLNGDEFRRSVYVQMRRSRPLSILETFDLPAPEPNCELRNASTVTPQSLLLMNNSVVVAHAADFAQRVRREAGDDPGAQVKHAWRLAFAAEPTADDVKEAVTFLEEQGRRFAAKAVKGDPRQLALANFCQALLSANQFLYVD
jgi:mono/diheme cytochrome c family protein